jgi:glycosyltransferase involved in cell wall biosynthesis
MKVLMISPQPFFEPRGTPISIYQRLLALSKLGHQVDLVTYPIGEDQQLPGLTILRTFTIPFIKKVPIGPSWKKLVLDFFLFFKVFWMLLSRHYDLIHSHEEGAFMGLILSFLFRRPHLYDMHSSLPRQLHHSRYAKVRPLVKLFSLLEDLVLKTCQVVLTIGQDLEDHVLTRNRHANHIRIDNIAISNNSNNGKISIAEINSRLGLIGKFPIVYTGNFERYQGLGLLFESARSVIEKHPQVVYVMVGGNASQTEHWKGEVARLGLENYVFFVGTIPLHETCHYLEIAEILVSPRTEGLSIPLKIYSYMQSGKPIVATNIAAHTQILTEETAVLVDRDPREFSKGILRLVEDPLLRETIGRRACELAEKEYSMEGYLTKLERAYLAIQYAKPIQDIPVTSNIHDRIMRIP